MQLCSLVRLDIFFSYFVLGGAKIFTAMLFSLARVSYGTVTPGRVAPLATNGAGLVLQIVYCSIFLKYSTGAPHTRIRNRILTVLFGLAVIVLISFVAVPDFNTPDFLHQGSASTDLLGLAASIFNTGMYGSPLSVMALVMRTKSVEFMPLALTLMTLFCCIIWATYAFYVDDLFIGIPNYIGVLLCFAQVALFCAYSGSRS